MATDKDTIIKIVQLLKSSKEQNLSDGILVERITKIINELKTQIKRDVIIDIKKHIPKG